MSKERSEKYYIPGPVVENADYEPLILTSEILRSWGFGINVERKGETAVISYNNEGTKKLMDDIYSTREMRTLLSVSIGLTRSLVDQTLKDCRWDELTKDRIRAFIVLLNLRRAQKQQDSIDINTARCAGESIEKSKLKLQELAQKGITPIEVSDIRQLLEEVAKDELKNI